MGSKKQQYSREFKQEAVKLITEQGYGISEAGRSLGVDPKNISRWKREFIRQGQIGKVKARVLSEEQEEISRLRKENARLKMEREILKKATAFFASESK